MLNSGVLTSELFGKVIHSMVPILSNTQICTIRIYSNDTIWIYLNNVSQRNFSSIQFFENNLGVHVQAQVARKILKDIFEYHYFKMYYSPDLEKF